MINDKRGAITECFKELKALNDKRKGETMKRTVKKLLIHRCTDPSMWYANKIGQTVPYISGPTSYGDFTTQYFDPCVNRVLTNIVMSEDCTLIEAIDPDEELERSIVDCAIDDEIVFGNHDRELF